MDVLLDQVKKYREEGKDFEADELYKSTYKPLQKNVLTFGLDLRYYSLSALSLRRYTLGRMYVKLRVAHFKESNSSYEDFLEVYNSFMEEYDFICEEPYLVDADI